MTDTDTAATDTAARIMNLVMDYENSGRTDVSKLAGDIIAALSRPAPAARETVGALRAMGQLDIAAAAGARAPATTNPIIDDLIDLTLKVDDALDNSEDRGEEHVIFEPWWTELCSALEKLEALPDDRPGYLMGPAAKVQWALSRPAPEADTAVEKTARNARVQARYDELIGIGKHGHYETMFRVVREEVERATDGWKPVPIELTEEIACALEGASPPDHPSWTYEALGQLVKDYRETWARVLAASPSGWMPEELVEARRRVGQLFANDGQVLRSSDLNIPGGYPVRWCDLEVLAASPAPQPGEKAR